MYILKSVVGFYALILLLAHTTLGNRTCESHYCPCCHSCVKNWSPFGNPHRPAGCPFCQVVERHRRICLELNTKLSPNAKGNLAYFGPHTNHVKQIQANFPLLNVFQFDYFAPGYKNGYYDRNTIRADVQSIPLQTNSLDYVIILHVLEHVPSLNKSLSELSRVIQHGGMLYHETPCSLRETNLLCSNTNRILGVCRQKDHLWDYSCKHIGEQLFFHGFSCKHTSYTKTNLKYYGIETPSSPLVRSPLNVCTKNNDQPNWQLQHSSDVV